MRSSLALGSLGVLLAVGLTFSGCFSSPADPSGNAPQSAPLPLPLGADPDKGALEGEVFGGGNEPLFGVRLVLLTEPKLETESDGNGYFVFINVTGGRFVLRAQATDYQTLEVSVNISMGRTELVRLDLLPSDPGRGIHPHDYWYDEQGQPVSSRILFNETLELPSATRPESLAESESRSKALATCSSSRGVLPPSLDLSIDTSTLSPSCFLPIVPQGTGPRDGIVWPGTKELDVNITFKKGTLPPFVKFVYYAANNTTRHYGVLVRDSPMNFTIPVQPVMTDSGHQAFTLWGFYLYVGAQGGAQGKEATLYNNDLVNALAGPIKVRITAFKGDVKLDPPHPNYWEEGRELLLVNETKFLKDSNQGNRAFLFQRSPTAQNSDVAFRLPPGKIVPPGTTRLDVKLEYIVNSSVDLGDLVSEKSLAFRTGAMNPATTRLAGLKNPAHESVPGRTTWNYSLVQPQNSGDLPETDPHYEKSSNWLFILANEGKEHDDYFVNECPYGCGGIKYHLTVTAINENWKPRS